MTNQKKLIIMVITFSLILVISSSYALLRSSKIGKNSYSINVGDLKAVFKDNQTEKLNLTNMYPMTDEEGKDQEDTLTFTIENTGTVGTYYDISIEEISNSPEFKSVIKYISNKDDKGYTEPKVLSENKYIELTGYIESGATRTYKVKIWLAEEADNTYMGKEFKAMLKVNAYQESNYAKDVIKSKLVKYEESSKEDFTGGLVAVNTAGELYNETDETEEIREYRYSGPNANNYVTFNDETWRIIGVFKDEEGKELVKIVRNSMLESNLFPETYMLSGTSYIIRIADTGGLIYWKYIIEKNYSDWNTAGLQYYLNTEQDDNGTNGYLHFLSDNAKKMIEETKYYLGNVNTDSLNSLIGDNTIQSYNNERGTKICENSCSGGDVWEGYNSEWTGKIALMYPSDVGYSANYGYWRDTKLENYNELAWSTSWLKEIFKDWQWLLSPTTVRKTAGSDWSPEGKLHLSYELTNCNRVQTTLYLKSNVKIISGDGTINNQYKLLVD